MNTRKTLMLALLGAIVCTASAGVGAADEVNVTFEGHFGGTTEAVAVSGNYAYIGQGEDLVVLDIGYPVSPVEFGRVSTGDYVRGVTVSGDYVERLITSRTQKGSTHRVHSKCILGP